jgi:enoyl-CoA hydratase
MGLRTEQRGAVAVLTLDDAERRNALSGAMVEEIVAAVGRAEADEATSALVITGAPPAFCSGADTSNLATLGHGGGSAESGSVRSLYDGFLAVRDATLPTVAAVNGPAVGAGFNLALCCDVRIAAESARFDSRFARIGLHPGGGHTWMLERTVGPQAAAAQALFGVAVDGPRAVELGLAWACVPDDETLDTAVTLAARAAETPRDLLRSVKATLREAPWVPDFATAVAVELERQADSFERGWVAERLAKRRP